MKSKVDRLDVDKLLPVPVGLSKLSDVVKNDVVKKDVYNVKIKNIEDKIPDITNVATIASLNAKIKEVKGKIPNITNLATTAALTAVEDNLIKKKQKKTKISEIENKITTDHDHDKHITTQEGNRLTSENFIARLKQANLASKNDIANFVNKTNFNEKLKTVTSNKNELNELSKKVKSILTKRLTKDLINILSILNGAKCFSLGLFQNYLVFIPTKGYFSGTTRMESWNVRRKY